MCRHVSEILLDTKQGRVDCEWDFVKALIWGLGEENDEHGNASKTHCLQI